MTGYSPPPDTIASLGIARGEQLGPASYPAGGFVIDTGLASITSAVVEAYSTLAVYAGRFDCRTEINTPLPGQLRVTVARTQYTRATGNGGMTSLAGGITIVTGSVPNTATEAAHTHAPGTLAGPSHTHIIDHTHANTGGPSASVNPTAGVAGTSAANSHVHNQPALGAVPSGADGTGAITGASAAGAAHAHSLSNVAQHFHTLNSATGEAFVTEFTAATDLSVIAFRWLAVA